MFGPKYSISTFYKIYNRLGYYTFNNPVKVKTNIKDLPLNVFVRNPNFLVKVCKHNSIVVVGGQ